MNWLAAIQGVLASVATLLLVNDQRLGHTTIAGTIAGAVLALIGGRALYLNNSAANTISNNSVKK